MFALTMLLPMYHIGAADRSWTAVESEFGSPRGLDPVPLLHRRPHEGSAARRRHAAGTHGGRVVASEMRAGAAYAHSDWPQKRAPYGRGRLH